MAGQTFLGLGFEAYRQKSRTLVLEARTLVSKRGTPAAQKYKLRTLAKSRKMQNWILIKSDILRKSRTLVSNCRGPAPGHKKNMLELCVKVPNPGFETPRPNHDEAKSSFFFLSDLREKVPNPGFKTPRPNPGKTNLAPSQPGKKQIEKNVQCLAPIFKISKP